MPYTITGPDGRCTFDTNTGGRCALVEDHQGQLHVTPHGEYFAERGGKVFGPVTGHSVTPSVDAAASAFMRLQQGIWCGAQEPGTSSTRADVRCQKPLHHAGDHHNAAGVSWAGASQSRLGNRVVALENTVKAMERQLVALGTPPPTRAELTTLTDRVDQLATRLTELEKTTADDRQQLERKLTALHRVEYGGGVAGLRRDVNRLVSLVGDEAWNHREGLATLKDLHGTDKAVVTLNDRVSRLENVCRASNSYDDKLCVLPKDHKGDHHDDQGETW